MRPARLLLLPGFALLAACGGPLPSAPEPAVAGAGAPDTSEVHLAAPSLLPSGPSPGDDDRSEADRALDPSRHPVEMLAFFGITAGQRVAELGAGTGYTTELLARAVGPTGVVYGQNPKWLLEQFAEGPWSARLLRHAMKNVTRLDRDFDDPFPPDLIGLDAVISILFYHDTVWLGTDRDRMNRAAFAALRSGGIYGIVDSNAQPNRGIKDVKTTHRIEESFVRVEVVAAGFKFVEEAAFLRNPADPRDWADTSSAPQEKQGTSDRFVMKFVKP